MNYCRSNYLAKRISLCYSVLLNFSLFFVLLQPYNLFWQLYSLIANRNIQIVYQMIHLSTSLKEAKFQKISFCPLKHKTTALKISILMAVWIFFSATSTAQNSPELKIHISNVAQNTSVYYSVMLTSAVSKYICLI